jgi:ubiquinone/menaquinone biosynthesis C-methylase UbiE
MNQKEVWNALAEPWQKYRQKMPDEVDAFIGDKSGLILDMGCGSGRNIVPGKKFIGIDFSEKMIKLAKKDAKNKDALFVVGDLRCLPFKNTAFDYVIYVSSLQCIKKDRKKSLKEMRRVIKEDSQAIITVWNYGQPRFNKKEDHIPWKHEGETYMRYYYLFSQKELEELLKETGFETLKIFGSISKVFNLFPRNIIAIVQKK